MKGKVGIFLLTAACLVLVAASWPFAPKTPAEPVWPIEDSSGEVAAPEKPPEVSAPRLSLSLSDGFDSWEDVSANSDQLHLVAVSRPGNGIDGHVSIVREKADGFYCHLDYCDYPAERRVAAGVQSWDFLGDLRYCDGSECGLSSRYYRLELDGYRYYVSFAGGDASGDTATLATASFVR